MDPCTGTPPITAPVNEATQRVTADMEAVQNEFVKIPLNEWQSMKDELKMLRFDLCKIFICLRMLPGYHVMQKHLSKS